MYVPPYSGKQCFAISSLNVICQVASVYAECGFMCPKDASCDYACYDPLTARVYQDQADAQLTYVSWSPEEETRLNRYFFDDSAGEDITVYIVDTGATLSHVVR